MAQKAVRDAHVSSAEGDSQLLPLQFQLAALQKEREQQKVAIKTLDTELTSRTEEHTRLRLKASELQIEISTLQSSYGAQVEELEGTVSNLTQAGEKAQALSASLATELATLTSTHSLSVTSAANRLKQEQEQHVAASAMHKPNCSPLFAVVP